MSETPQSKPVVLVVDDEQYILNVVKRILARKPVTVEVLTAGGVQEAKTAIQKFLVDGRRRISAVLTDWNMLDGTGADVITAAREAGISSVGVMTGLVEQNQDGIRATGVELILEKPFDAPGLRAAIAKLLTAPTQE